MDSRPSRRLRAVPFATTASRGRRGDRLGRPTHPNTPVSVHNRPLGGFSRLLRLRGDCSPGSTTSRAGLHGSRARRTLDETLARVRSRRILRRLIIDEGRERGRARSVPLRFPPDRYAPSIERRCSTISKTSVREILRFYDSTVPSNPLLNFLREFSRTFVPGAPWIFHRDVNFTVYRFASVSKFDRRYPKRCRVSAINIQRVAIRVLRSIVPLKRVKIGGRTARLVPSRALDRIVRGVARIVVRFARDACRRRGSRIRGCIARCNASVARSVESGGRSSPVIAKRVELRAGCSPANRMNSTRGVEEPWTERPRLPRTIRRERSKIGGSLGAQRTEHPRFPDRTVPRSTSRARSIPRG